MKLGTLLSDPRTIESVDGRSPTFRAMTNASDVAADVVKAVNAHDGLVEALKNIKAHLDADDENSYRADDREGAMDTCFAIACAALAALEGK